MPDEVLLVVLVVMAIGLGWKWAKNRIDEKKWRETSLPRKFFISLIALIAYCSFLDRSDVYQTPRTRPSMKNRASKTGFETERIIRERERKNATDRRGGGCRVS